MKLTKIHRVLEFKQSDWMKKYSDFSTEKRMNTANDFEKDFFELIINSVYRKNNEKFRPGQFHGIRGIGGTREKS